MSLKLSKKYILFVAAVIAAVAVTANVAYQNHNLTYAGIIIGVVFIGCLVSLFVFMRLARTESELKYLNAVNTTSEGFWMVDREFRIIDVNETLAGMLGYGREEITGRSPLEFVSEDSLQTMEKYAANILPGEHVRYEVGFKTKAGGVMPAVINSTAISGEGGKPAGAFAFVTDITERKRMEEELQRAHKLGSIGVLAGGLAHDFNNLLTSVFVNISMAKRFSDQDGKAHERLVETERALERTKHLTKQLLSIAKCGTPVKRALSIDGFLEDSVRFALSGSNIGCEVSLAEGLWCVQGDEGQLCQVVQNVVTNARDAVEQKGMSGGFINVRAENHTLAAEENAFSGESAARYVAIYVEDSGPGIERKHMQKIFDPCFTTREKGSGLGLATAYSIVKKHGGAIKVKSKKGEGTTVNILLPACDKEPVEKDEAGEGLKTGRGRVLIMDDEDYLREVIGVMLRSLGYDVEFAENGETALELYVKAAGEGQDFDAVVLDLTVPGGMGGRETFDELRKIDPGVRAIVSSGYADDLVIANYTGQGFSAVLLKPYNVKEVSDTLYSVIKE